MSYLPPLLGTGAGTLTAGNDARIIGVSVDSPAFGVVTGSVSSAQQTANVAGIQAAWALAASLGKALLFGAGIYQVNGTLQLGGGSSGQVRILGLHGKTIIQSSLGVACTFTGSISGTTLTVASVQSGALCPGCNINTGSGWTTIVRAIGSGTWAVAESLTVASGTSMTAGAPIVLVGNGVQPGGFMHGEVCGLTVYGPSAAPTTGSTGIMLASMLQVKVSQCEVNNVTAAFDMVGNCYGSSLEYCRAGFGNGCMVGWHVRGVSAGDVGAGNQISAYQSWLSGVAAGVQIGPGADGVAMRDGQIGATGSDDSYGNLVIGKSYYSGQTGGVGCVVYHGLDAEQFGAWQYRLFGPCYLTVMAQPVLSNAPLPKIPWGVMRVTNGGNANISLHGVQVRGNYRAAKPIVVDAGTYPSFFITELHSSIDLASKFGVASDGTGGAVVTPLQCQSLLVASAPLIGGSFGVYSDYLSQDTKVVLNGVPLSALALIKAAQNAGGRTLPTLASGAPAIWLDASQPTTLLVDGSHKQNGNGGTVQTFVDALGSGRNVTQATLANQPTLAAAKANGRSMLAFNGTSTLMRSPTGQAWVNAMRSGSPFTYRLVFITSAMTTQQGLVTSNVSGNTSYAPGVDVYVDSGNVINNNIFATGTGATGTAVGQLPQGTINYLVATYDGTTLKVRTTAGGTDTTNTYSGAGTAVDQLTLGFMPTVNWYLNGFFGEFALWPGVATSAEVNALLTEAATWWGA